MSKPRLMFDENIPMQDKVTEFCLDNPNLNIKQIAQYFGVKYPTVAKWLKGIYPRKKY